MYDVHEVRKSQSDVLGWLTVCEKLEIVICSFVDLNKSRFPEDEATEEGLDIKSTAQYTKVGYQSYFANAYSINSHDSKR